MKMKMKSGRSVCVLICLLCVVKANVKLASHVEELTVTAEDLKHCGTQRKLCVTSSADCLHTPSDLHSAPSDSRNFVNTLCHYLIYENTFSCRWYQMNGLTAETNHTFIFSRTEDVIHCPSILNVVSRFSLTIKSKNMLRQEQFSDVYQVDMESIAQAPRPVITSVNVTDTSVSVTWSSGKYSVTECRIRYKRLYTDSWTEVRKTFQLLEAEGVCVSAESLYVVEGLQSFSEYRLSVSCFHGFGRWSDWSDETRVKTSESRPSAAPSLSYYVASDVKPWNRQLVLLLKPVEVRDAGGLVGEYRVSYRPIKRPDLEETISSSDLTVVVRLSAEEHEVGVCVCNSAGCSALRRLRVDASQAHGVSAVKALWVHSDGSSLRVRWDHELARVNVTEFAIAWSDGTNPGLKHWQRVNGSTSSTRLTGVRRHQTVRISVFPVCWSLSGPPASISADLQHGALVDVVGFAHVSASSSSLSVQWTWRETRAGVNVLQYRLVLKGPDESVSLTVFPDKQRHSFHNLQPNTKYSVLMLGETPTGNLTRASLDVSTLLLDYEEMMRFAVPVILLLLVCGTFSLLTRTICRQYFFPMVADPRFSLIGHWLLNPPLQADGKKCVLKPESVFLLDQQTEKSVIRVERRVSLTSEHEDMNASEISTSAEGTALWKPPSDYVENTHAPSSLPEYVDLPIMPDRADYVQSRQIPPS